MDEGCYFYHNFHIQLFLTFKNHYPLVQDKVSSLLIMISQEFPTSALSLASLLLTNFCHPILHALISLSNPLIGLCVPILESGLAMGFCLIAWDAIDFKRVPKSQRRSSSYPHSLAHSLGMLVYYMAENEGRWPHAAKTHCQVSVWGVWGPQIPLTFKFLQL